MSENAEAIQLDFAANSTVFPWFGPYDNTPCNNVIITDCRFASFGSGIGSHSAGVGIRHTGVLISNCTFTNLGYTCIKPMNWSGVKIIGNRMATAFRGIFAQAIASNVCSDYTISGNTIYNMTATDLDFCRGIHILGTDLSRNCINCEYMDKFNGSSCNDSKNTSCINRARFQSNGLEFVYSKQPAF